MAACLMVAPLQAAYAQSPATQRAERFKAAEAYMHGNLSALVTDLNMQAAFTGGGRGVIYRKGPKGQGAILLADPATGTQAELTTEAALTPKLKAVGVKADGIVDVRPTDYDADKKVLKFSAGGRDWIYEFATDTLTANAPYVTPDGMVSPDGKYKVIARDYNLYLVDVATNRETPLTFNGGYDQRYGQNYPLFGDMADANSETPKMRLSVQWSEDSQKILTYRMDRNGAYIWTGVQQAPQGSHFPRAFNYVYPSAGAVNVPLVKPVLIDLKGKATYLDVPATELLWPGDPAVVVRVREALKPIVTVTSSGIRHAPEWGGNFVISERSGWAQLYFIKTGENPDGGKALTSGEWEVTGIERIDKDDVIIAGIGREKGVNPYASSLYRVTKGGKITHLTPEPLDHNTTISPDGKWIIDRMSSPVDPTRTVLRDARDGKIVAELGRADISALLATGFTVPEPFETLADDGKTRLYGMIHRPKNFDPSKSYPVIENVYTGPTTHRFTEDYGGNIVNGLNAMAQLGAIVVTIDGRGTSQRGKAFRSSAYQNLAEAGLDDHIWVLKAMKAKYPYFDLNRVGVYGGSAGGYDTARFVLRRPDVYKVGVASSGNHDQRIDKAWWPEVSMGIADDATWEANSNIPVAKNLKGKLMLIHGDIDDNVPVAATMKLSKALIDAGKDHELVILPNTKHNVSQPYYFQKMFGFFYDNLIEPRADDPIVQK
ncbi:MAG: S9 family peptidase [Asticcacaulis sp. 32-58-5]|nr:MAG: S9 family peptidase [Asticcacaulis sp. 32-58-5]